MCSKVFPIVPIKKGGPQYTDPKTYSKNQGPLHNQKELRPRTIESLVGAEASWSRMPSLGDTRTRTCQNAQ